MIKTLTMALLLTSCTSEGKARSTLEAEGYTNIEITGYSYGSCSKDDSTCTGFVARSPGGRKVTGAVGCGYVFKGCTVRIHP